MLFSLLFGFDAIVASVFVYFFLVGLGDGSVSSFNMGLWLAILGGLAVVLFGSWKLRAAGRRGAALTLLGVLAFPAAMFGLFMLALILLNPDWK